MVKQHTDVLDYGQVLSHHHTAIIVPAERFYALSTVVKGSVTSYIALASFLQSKV